MTSSTSGRGDGIQDRLAGQLKFVHTPLMTPYPPSDGMEASLQPGAAETENTDLYIDVASSNGQILRKGKVREESINHEQVRDTQDTLAQQHSNRVLHSVDDLAFIRECFAGCPIQSLQTDFGTGEQRPRGPMGACPPHPSQWPAMDKCL